jgi:hypothetical protein
MGEILDRDSPCMISDILVSHIMAASPIIRLSQFQTAILVGRVHERLLEKMTTAGKAWKNYMRSIINREERRKLANPNI